MDLAKSFGGLTAPAAPSASQPAPEAKAVVSKPKKPAKPQATEKATSTRGKSSNPNYEPVKVLVKTEYRTKASRKWTDEQGRGYDFSDLIEKLLIDYIGA